MLQIYPEKDSGRLKMMLLTSNHADAIGFSTASASDSEKASASSRIYKSTNFNFFSAIRNERKTAKTLGRA